MQGWQESCQDGDVWWPEEASNEGQSTVGAVEGVYSAVRVYLCVGLQDADTDHTRRELKEDGWERRQNEWVIG